MKKSSNIALVVLTAVGLIGAATTGCSSSSSPSQESVEPGNVEVIRSAQSRNESPWLSQTEQATLAKSEADFAIEMYQAVAKEKANEDVFLSPHSISVALAMTYAGAGGETASEMKKSLHFDLPDDRIHPAFDYLDLALSSRGKNAEGKDGKPFRLNITNSIWGQKGMTFGAPFLDTIAVNYGSGVNVVDFATETEASRLAINGWVEQKTENRIKELLPSLSSSTRMVLVNAVYFNAAWSDQFQVENTKQAPFTKLDGSTTQVSMMLGQTHRPYLKGDGFEAVAMPYDGKELSMLIIAPTTGSFAKFETAMTGGKVLDIFAGLQSHDVILSFPKLKVAGPTFSVRKALESLGMKQAFLPGADFTKMAPGLHVSDVLHQTFLELDEKGTEAAAATAVIMAGSSMPVDPPKPIAMTVDRPFITAIVDHQTKTIVFVGRILEPKL